jgi:mannitol-1-phosphate 5-dehydrogenase
MQSQPSTAVIIGAGKIGCGYLAPVFAEAGWDVVLVARSHETVARIRAAGEYTVRTTDGGGTRWVRPEAVLIGTPEFDRAVARAGVVATAVGSRSVEDLGDPLARALAARGGDRPVDVWTVENADVAPTLDAAVRAAAAARGLALPPVGFSGAIAFAAVTQGDWKSSARPEFVGDSARWLLVDAARLVTPLPRLARVGATDRYEEHLQAKRFVFSAGHALCAYLGLSRGHRYIHEAVGDPLVRPLIARSLCASRRALLGAGARDTGPVEWVLERYADDELADPLLRVARDPIRKLSPGGPLVGPAMLVVEATGTAPVGLAAGIAAALRFRNPADPQACLIAEMLGEPDGLRTVLSHVCGLDPHGLLAHEVTRLYRRQERRPRRPGRQHPTVVTPSLVRAAIAA